MRQYKTSGPNRQWQSDLVDMQSYKHKNGGYAYILTAIDVFSRFARAVPLKTKAFPHVINGFKSILADAQPHLLQTDDGMEFINKNIQAYFNENDIKQFSIKSVYKAAMVERFHRTLRSRMYRYFTKHDTKRWVDVLPELLHSYNNASHSSLQGLSPYQVYYDKVHAATIWDHQNMSSSTPSSAAGLVVGDLVRLALTKKQFDHGYTPNWTREIYRISGIDKRDVPYMYKVAPDIGGKFYREGLQKVSINK